jgi:hypothetical protein
MPQPKNMQFAKEVFEQKAIDEAKALLEEKGYYVGDNTQSGAKAEADYHGRAKSERMLFGEQKKSVAGSSKKRDMKA